MITDPTISSDQKCLCRRFLANAASLEWAISILGGIPLSNPSFLKISISCLTSLWTHRDFQGLTVTDGLFNVSRFHRISKLADDASKWDSGWTKDDKDITFDSDKNYISNLGGKTYMAACSPWFFTVGGYSNSRFILSNASPSTMDVTRTTRTGSTAPMTGYSLHAGSSSSQTENKWIWCSY